VLRCPVCRSPLVRLGNRYSCNRGHSFDIARSGYINLLGSGSARVRGDDIAMLRNRRAFLEAGFYQPLLQYVTSCARAACQRVAATPRLLDVSCGEGYYTGGLATTLPERAEIWGIDISRAAVEMASKRHKRANFAVASARILPTMDEALDLIVVIFGPQQPAEFRRVLKRSGLALIVAPGESHIIEVRHRLCQRLAQPGRGGSHPWAGLKTASFADLRYPMRMSRADLEHLIGMTPNAWTAS
jgi:23S rRNA (guanine745-N1)-methyltransferase